MSWDLCHFLWDSCVHPNTLVTQQGQSRSGPLGAALPPFQQGQRLALPSMSGTAVGSVIQQKRTLVGGQL